MVDDQSASTDAEAAVCEMIEELADVLGRAFTCGSDCDGQGDLVVQRAVDPGGCSLSVQASPQRSLRIERLRRGSFDSDGSSRRVVQVPACEGKGFNLPRWPDDTVAPVLPLFLAVDRDGAGHELVLGDQEVGEPVAL
jgi:hypothetical protein